MGDAPAPSSAPAPRPPNRAAFWAAVTLLGLALVAMAVLIATYDPSIQGPPPGMSNGRESTAPSR
jgi:hypothetical protein